MFARFDTSNILNVIDGSDESEHKRTKTIERDQGHASDGMRQSENTTLD